METFKTPRELVRSAAPGVLPRGAVDGSDEPSAAAETIPLIACRNYVRIRCRVH